MIVYYQEGRGGEGSFSIVAYTALLVIRLLTPTTGTAPATDTTLTTDTTPTTDTTATTLTTDTSHTPSTTVTVQSQ